MLVGQLTLSAGASGYLDFFLRECNTLDLMVEVLSSAATASITLYDGYGGLDPNISCPYNQALPNTVGVNGHNTSVVVYDLKGTNYPLSTFNGGRQTVSVGINRTLGADYISVGIPTVTNQAQINVYARVC